jgi:glycosyltransferase involved in cell wall biosynthesis
MIQKVVVLWRRFGPYHLARLRGVATWLGADDFAVHGIEVAESDHYAWAPANLESEFKRRCLFPGRSYSDMPISAIRKAVVQVLDEIQPDAVAINGWSVPEALAALGWCRRNGKIAVLMSETLASDSRRTWWKEWLKARIVRRFDAALVGGRLHAEYVSRLGLSRNRIFLGYDAVDNDYFANGAEEARRQMPEKGRPCFFANSRFIERKNIDGLLRAYAMYRQQIPDPWDIVISGSGEEDARLKALAKQLGFFADQPSAVSLKSSISFPGFIQYGELPGYYGRAGAFIHPAKSEPWGLVVNEACASGLPVLVSKNVGACCELVEHGVNGLLFDPFSDSDMAAAMVRMTRLPKIERETMGARSREIVGHWGADRFARGLFDAIAAGQSGVSP